MNNLDETILGTSTTSGDGTITSRSSGQSDVGNLEINNNEDELENLTKDAIVSAIFETLNFVSKTNISLNDFSDLLAMAKKFYCKGAQLDIDDTELGNWPKDWTAAKKYLEDMGYKDAKEYTICLSDEHPCHWDIMDKKEDVCRHCGEHGTISYYYLGLETKVKQWASDKDMCYKMSEHWREKQHWFKRTEGWHLKKELWDGDRFPELSWFFDCDSFWCLPVRCEMEQCDNIISPEIIESLPEITPGVKEVTCALCHHAFKFTPKNASGDPRNIALIGKVFEEVSLLRNNF